MNLTSEQLQAIHRGESVRVTIDSGDPVVIVRADIYESIAADSQVGLPPEKVGQLVEEAMRDYDANDPLLESYQQYRV